MIHQQGIIWVLGMRIMIIDILWIGIFIREQRGYREQSQRIWRDWKDPPRLWYCATCSASVRFNFSLCSSRAGLEPTLFTMPWSICNIATGWPLWEGESVTNRGGWSSTIFTSNFVLFPLSKHPMGAWTEKCSEDARVVCWKWTEVALLDATSALCQCDTV